MKKTILALAISAAASTTSATTWNLVDVRSFSASGSGVLTGQIRVGGVAVDSVEFTDNPAIDLISSGDFSVLFHIGNFDANGNGLGASMFTWNFSNLVASTAGSFSADFSCTEGTFTFTVGASLCGNYNFGPNYTNESTVMPDGTVAIGGDDTFSGICSQVPCTTPIGQSIADFQGLLPTGATDFVSTIILSNGAPFGSGSQFTWAAEVPIPATAWLFGSALLGLSGISRKRKTINC
jgi:hypothetical protein